MMRLEFYRYEINYNIVKALRSYSKIKVSENDNEIIFKFNNFKDYELFKKIKYFFNDFEAYTDILRYFKSDFETNLQWYSYKDFELKVQSLTQYNKEEVLDKKTVNEIVMNLLHIMQICKHNTKINNFNDFEVYCIKYLFLLMQVKKHYRQKIKEIIFEDDKFVSKICFSVFLENLLNSRIYFNYLNEIKKKDIIKFQKFLNDHDVKDAIIFLLKKHPFEYVFKFIVNINKNDMDSVFYLEFFSKNYNKTHRQEKFFPNREVQMNKFKEDLKFIFNEDVDIFRKQYKTVKPLNYNCAPLFVESIKELTNTKELFMESSLMKHCIRTYSWKWPKYRFFNIRLNDEISTLELLYTSENKFKIIQHKGKRNRKPSEEHILMGIRFCHYLNHKEIEVY